MKIFETHKKIKILVDDEDFDFVSKHKWHLDKDGYPRTHVYINNKRTMTRMHRMIMNARTGDILDHIDGNIHNNCKNNLRFCTAKENRGNSKKTKYKKSSIYKGVTWHKYKKLWMVAVKGKFIGYFKKEKDAASAYNQHALIQYGEFARLNILEIK